MSARQITICNKALNKIGAQPITTIDDPVKGARACKQHWDNALNATLCDLNWKFARRRFDCPKDDYKVPFEYKNAFALPGDFLKLQYIWNVEKNRVSDEKYSVEEGRILTDSENCRIVYTGTLASVSTMPDHFERCLIERLAYEIALNLSTLTPEMSQIMYKQYELALANAIDIEGNQQSQQLTKIDDWITIRRRFYSRQFDTGNKDYA